MKAYRVYVTFSNGTFKVIRIREKSADAAISAARETAKRHYGKTLTIKTVEVLK